MASREINEKPFEFILYRKNVLFIKIEYPIYKFLYLKLYHIFQNILQIASSNNVFNDI